MFENRHVIGCGQECLSSVLVSFFFVKVNCKDAHRRHPTRLVVVFFSLGWSQVRLYICCCWLLIVTYPVHCPYPWSCLRSRQVESKHYFCPPHSCSVGLHLYWSLTVSSSCNSSTNWQIPELAPSLQVVLGHCFDMSVSIWGPLYFHLPIRVLMVVLCYYPKLQPSPIDLPPRNDNKLLFGYWLIWLLGS